MKHEDIDLNPDEEKALERAEQARTPDFVRGWTDRHHGKPLPDAATDEYRRGWGECDLELRR